jgi:hypothetical protein
VKHVHEECLKTWVLSRHAEVVKSSCELCKTEFKMRLDVKLLCRFRNNRHSKLRRCLHYFFLISILVTLSASCWVLFVYIDDSSDSRKDGLIIGLIVNSLLMLMFLVMLISSIVTDSKCIHQLNTWRILERPPDTPSVTMVTRNTQPSRSQTYQASVSSIENSDDLPELLILPQVTLVSGRQVETPRMTPRLSRVQSTDDNLQVFVARSQYSSSSMRSEADQLGY